LVARQFWNKIVSLKAINILFPLETEQFCKLFAGGQWPPLQKRSQETVGATIGRPAILEQNCIAECDKHIIPCGNLNNFTNCSLAANGRPYDDVDNYFLGRLSVVLQEI